MGIMGVMGIMGESLNSLNSLNSLITLSNNCFSIITLSVIVLFSGLGDTLVEGTMKKRVVLVKFT